MSSIFIVRNNNFTLKIEVKEYYSYNFYTMINNLLVNTNESLYNIAYNTAYQFGFVITVKCDD